MNVALKSTEIVSLKWQSTHTHALRYLYASSAVAACVHKLVLQILYGLNSIAV